VREIEAVSNDDATERARMKPAALDRIEGSRGTPSGARSTRRLIVRGKKPFARRSRLAMGPIESILGQDERVRILDTDQDPWRMICQLSIHGEDGSAVGTGWFAGPRTIITAGHCVFDAQIGGWPQRIVVRAGLDREEQPFADLEATRFSTTRRWHEDRDPDYDYGAIHLGPEADAVTSQTGWFSIAAFNDAALDEQRINVSGYPGDKGGPPSDAFWATEQWFHAKQIVRVTPRRLFYDVDTIGGQSGAPAWIDEDGSPCVVGIHAYGAGGAVHLGIEANSAPRIDAAVLRRIRRWIKADSGT
jgi:V8-like Glu-specific endopeptidase